jgi:alcohol dehydrogenase
MKRRSLLLTAPRQLEWVVEDLSSPAPEEVLVQTIAGAVSVGTELPQYQGTEREVVARGYPRMTGYESLGEVVACGAAVRGLEPGDRVIAFYGHRTYALVQSAKAIRVPPGISDALALLVILTCDVAKGIRKLKPRQEDLVLVTGAGAIGLLTLWMLRATGVRSIDVVEPLAGRQALARHLGARCVVRPNASHLTDVYTCGFECSSRQAGFALLQERAAIGGRICVLADGNHEPLVLMPSFHTKELSIVGSSDGWDYQQHARWYFEQIVAGAPALEALFDAHVSADDLASLFTQMARGERTPVKALIHYNSSSMERL